MLWDIHGRKASVHKWGAAYLLTVWVEGEKYTEGFTSLKAIFRYVEDYGYNFDSVERDEVTQEIKLVA